MSLMVQTISSTLQFDVYDVEDNVSVDTDNLCIDTDD